MIDKIMYNIPFNRKWKFFLTHEKIEKPEQEKLLQPDFDDSSWQNISIPHDWAAEQKFDINLEGATGKLNWRGLAFYRKKFEIPPEDEKCVYFLDFDGAMANAEVFINGHHAGSRKYGYIPFRIDITNFLEPGKINTAAVRLDTFNWNSRWYPGAGLYRKVALVKKYPLHIRKCGQYITTPVISDEYAEVSLQIEIVNKFSENAEFTLETQIFEFGTDAVKGKKITGCSSQCKTSAGSLEKVQFTLKIPHPELWDTENPFRYIAVTRIIRNGKAVDSDTQAFGIRNIKFTNKGFFLNGRKTQIKGVCMHHDLGPLGTAFNSSAFLRQMEKLREMGANAVRTAHNPPAPEVYEICDRLGIMLEIDTFDCWLQSKKKDDYGKIFDECHQKDLTDIIRAGRSHPSVILWNLGNETIEIRRDEGKEIMHSLRKIARAADPSRPVTMGSNVPQAAFSGIQHETDVFGFNYCLNAMLEFHKNPENRNIPFHGSETASALSSRGEYFFPVPKIDFSKTPAYRITRITDMEQEKNKSLCSDFQVTSYDIAAPGWGCTPDFQFASMEKAGNTCGEFVWTGFDYIGEPTPYNGDMTNLLNFTDPEKIEKLKKQLETDGTIPVPSRSSYFGIFDLCGFPKDRYYLYRSRWRPDVPTAHILPHWNWEKRRGMKTPVFVYTSGDEAELFLNGKSLGRRKKEKYKHRLCWYDVIYEPGIIRAETFKNGKPWCIAEIKTTGAPFKIKLEQEKKPDINFDDSLFFVVARITDEEGNTVPVANCKINFSVSGPGKIIAVDNGNPTSFKSFRDTSANAFNGLCLAVIKPADKNSTVILKAESPELELEKLELR